MTVINRMRPARLATFIAMAFAGSSPALCASVAFNTDLIELDNPGMDKADLSAFESDSQAPGNYHVDIIVDDALVETGDIRFTAGKNENGDETLQPCLSSEQLKRWGLKPHYFPHSVRNRANVSIFRRYRRPVQISSLAPSALCSASLRQPSTCRREVMSRRRCGMRG